MSEKMGAILGVGIIAGIGVLAYTIFKKDAVEPQIIITMKETLQYYKDKGDEINNSVQDITDRIDTTLETIDTQMVEVRGKIETAIETAIDLRKMVGGESQYDLETGLAAIKAKMDEAIIEPIKNYTSLPYDTRRLIR